MIKPASWTHTRRAPGEIQMAWSDVLQSKGRFLEALQRYQNALDEIVTAGQLIEDQKEFDVARIEVLNDKLKRHIGFQSAILVMKAASMGLELGAEQADETSDIIAEGIPKIVGLLAMDPGAPIRALAKGIGHAVEVGLKIANIVTEEAEAALESAKELADEAEEIKVEQEDRDWEVGGLALDLEAKLRQEPVARLEALTQAEEFKQAVGRYQATLAKGLREWDELIAFRKKTAAKTADSRYKDMAFRVFRNDALQKYRAQFDLAARYTYLAAAAYDYETNLLGSAGGAAQQFFTDIVRQRSLGEVDNGQPIPGSPGLADPLGRLAANFAVLKSQLGFNNPQTETNRFSLRTQGFRIHADPAYDAGWRTKLQSFRVDHLFDIPEFRRFARPFAPESLGPQPGLVIPLGDHDGATTVTFGLNYFGWPLGPGDSAYDPTLFVTKVRTVGVWFGNYDVSALSNTPRVYLIPVGADRLRSPSATNFTIRDWTIVDQKVPVPFPIGASDLSSPSWIPENNELSGFFGDIRQYSSFRAFADTGAFDPTQTTADSRLIGRSVWNTKWLLIIAGGTFLNDPTQGLDTFICGQPLPGQPDTAGCAQRDGNGNTDIKLFFQTYAYSGN
jgi:hypothetical protein